MEAVGPAEVAFLLLTPALLLIGALEGARRVRRNRAAGRPAAGALAWALTASGLLLIVVAIPAAGLLGLDEQRADTIVRVGLVVLLLAVAVGIAGFGQGLARSLRT